ncbi:MAG: Mu-like prophage major head subunit gpT family protein, partial [Pseudomonadota bacterium]
GEIKATTRAEAGEKMRVKTYARKMNVGRNLMMNDDLGLLGDMTMASAEAAAQTETDVMVRLLRDNPNLSDGTPVFDASRGNVGTAGAVSETTIDEANQAMWARRGLDGQTFIAARPAFLLVGPDNELAARKLLTAVTPNSIEGANPLAGTLELLVEPRLSDGSWYVFAAPGQLVTMQHAYLASAQGPQVQRVENFDTLGMSYRVFLDFGAGWVDWRGAQKNAGA